ncbi:hypothetical protein WJX74_006291 [Apatococcus lobatus]|uniref:Carbohydrate kinase PfkB domain-containing protein n=1 Tax=Apatococcus lobatus TaxID=904363 RepID=A0AAW1S238_9CHLO
MAAVRRPHAAAPITAFGSHTELPSPHSRAGLHPLSSIPVFQSTPHSQDVWDVVGLGQGMVDFSAQVDDALLERLEVEKGARRIISVEQRGQILQALDAGSYQISPGGSMSNTMLALARLGGASKQHLGMGRMQAAFAAIAGSDPLGRFFLAQLQQAGLTLLATPTPDSNTGTVIVLTTPDANRTMLSYLGSHEHLQLSEASRAAITRSRMLIIEGYLWEMPGALEAILAAISHARTSGCLVAMTAGDVGCVQRHRGDFWAAIDTGNVDILFTNRNEAAALVGKPECSADEAARDLGSHCMVGVAVTDGSRGSCISALGQVHSIPPYWIPCPPTDTCGAGDAYAAGFIYGLLNGFDVPSMGRAAARVASIIISRSGASLSATEAEQLAEELPLANHRELSLAPRQSQQHSDAR